MTLCKEMSLSHTTQFTVTLLLTTITLFHTVHSLGSDRAWLTQTDPTCSNTPIAAANVTQLNTCYTVATTIGTFYAKVTNRRIQITDFF